MALQQTDKVFAGSIPQLYDRYFVPLIFEPYALDLAERVAARPPRRILEVAAGTGVVTRALARVLPASSEIVATDLNQPMLDHARSVGAARVVEWRQADAMKLPFPEATFDALVCQFGVMFFPDKPGAFGEFRRVLKRGGRLLFNAWDRIEENEFADVVTQELARFFPADPPRFMARTPHGYHDKDAIVRDLSKGGLGKPEIITLAARSVAPSYRDPAIAYCQGSPLRNEIEARAASRLAEATEVVAEAIAARYGRGAVDAKIQAHIVSVTA